MDLNQIGVRVRDMWADNDTRKKIIIGASAAAIVTAGIIATPHISTAIKKSKATDLINKAKSEYLILDTIQTEANDQVNKESGILKQSEQEELFKNINSTRPVKIQIGGEIKRLDSLFVCKDYDKIIDSFNPEKRPRSQPTLLSVIEAQQSLLKVVLWYCENKDKLNRTAFEQEQFLKARLSHPIENALEIPVDMAIRFDKHYTSIPNEYLVKGGSRPVELAILFDSYYALIPRKSQLLDSLTSVMDPKLHNSLGANLAAHQGMLKHMLDYAHTRGGDRIRAKTQKIYDDALLEYLSAVPLNDSLRFQDEGGTQKWYRPWLHAQKLSPDSLKLLVEKQGKVIAHIKNGDNLLVELEKYNEELHNRYYVMVVSHSKSPTTFSHWRDVSHYDPVKEETVTETEHYTTDGYKFYYTLRTQHPNSYRDELVYVGEKDEEDHWRYDTWEYKNNEQVGYIRAWKMLHEDNVEIRRNHMRGKGQPYIEKLAPDCISTKVLDFYKK